MQSVYFQFRHLSVLAICAWCYCFGIFADLASRAEKEGEKSMKRRISALLLCVILLLTACGQAQPVVEEPQQYDEPLQLAEEMPYSDYDEQAEYLPEVILPVQIYDGIYDIGAILFAGQDAFISARVLDGNRLLAWNMLTDESVIFDYSSGEVLHRFSPSIRRLGLEHFYSQHKNGESNYTITLYDNQFNVLAQHETGRPAIPAIDGITILYDGRPPTKRNTQTNEEVEIRVNDIAEGYTGGIWVRDFDGQWMFFSSTHNPMPGNAGVGAYNVITGQAIFRGDFPELFSAIPESFGDGKAIFWQCGCAHGTYGSYSVIIDTENSEIRIVDVGNPIVRISDNGRFLVAVDSEWDQGRFPTQTITLSRIRTYDGGTLAPVSSRSFIPQAFHIEADGGGHFYRISISNDGRHVFFTGFIEENGIRRQSLFMVVMQVLSPAAAPLPQDFVAITEVSGGAHHTVMLREDGTIAGVGCHRHGQLNVSDWYDIVAISAGDMHTIGLRPDGTVVATEVICDGDPHFRWDFGQSNVSDWYDIVAIATGWAHTVGLKSDGTLVTAGSNSSGALDVAGWRDIVAVSTCVNTVGLRADGTVVATAVLDSGLPEFVYYGQSSVSDWYDIIAIAAGGHHTAGLRSDGTVIAVGANWRGQLEVADWRDIVAVSATASHTIGLKSDGTVVVAGASIGGHEQHNVSGWRDIVAISSGRFHTIGLRYDGVVMATGSNIQNQLGRAVEPGSYPYGLFGRLVNVEGVIILHDDS